MATISYISPKSVLVKISEIFTAKNVVKTQTPTEEQTSAIPNNAYFWGLAMNNEPKPTPKPKLNVSLADLKVISTALLHYRKELAKKGNFERADEVGEIDKRFYDLIIALEEKVQERQEAE